MSQYINNLIYIEMMIMDSTFVEMSKVQFLMVLGIIRQTEKNASYQHMNTSCTNTGGRQAMLSL